MAAKHGKRGKEVEELLSRQKILDMADFSQEKIAVK